MTKISNKKYDEFWKDGDLDIDNQESTEQSLIQEDVDVPKKEIKRKKEVEVLSTEIPVEEQHAEVSETISSIEENITEVKKEKKPKKKKEIISVQEEIVVEEIQPVVIQPIVIDSDKTFYQNFISDNKPYKIYHQGLIIYDSIKHKNSPIFEDEYFILFGKKYIYRGSRFQKY